MYNAFTMSQKTVRKKPRRNKKYRFQLLHGWLIQRYSPIKVLDVGGGKGLLSYLLNESGWQATVVDPISDFRPIKYRDTDARHQVKVSKKDQEAIPRISSEFKERHVNNSDIIIGLHAHGSNIKIINACATYNRDFLLMPCCVVNEPINRKPGVDWLESLVGYAISKGFKVKRAKLDFKGQNVLIYTDKNLLQTGSGKITSKNGGV